MEKTRPVPMEEFFEALKKAICEGHSLRSEKAIAADEAIHKYTQELKQKIRNKKE